MRERCGNRLPRFTLDQRNMLVGSADFFGLNHYSSHLCEQPAWYKELAPQQDDEERENKLVGVILCWQSHNTFVNYYFSSCPSYAYLVV
jgi:hypothetical protein